MILWRKPKRLRETFSLQPDSSGQFNELADTFLCRFLCKRVTPPFAIRSDLSIGTRRNRFFWESPRLRQLATPLGRWARTSLLAQPSCAQRGEQVAYLRLYFIRALDRAGNFL